MPKSDLSTLSLTNTFRDLFNLNNDVIELVRTDIMVSSFKDSVTEGIATLNGTFTSNVLSTDEMKTDSIRHFDDTNSRIIFTSPLTIENENLDQIAVEFARSNSPKMNLQLLGIEWSLGMYSSNDFYISKNGSEKLRIDTSGNMFANDGEAKISITAPVFDGIINGEASTITNGVYTVGNQTVIGEKVFLQRVSSTLFQGDLWGNATTFTNGMYIVGNQSISGEKTFSSSISTGVPTLSSHALRNDRFIIAGTGLAGGGELFDNRNLALTGQALALHNFPTQGLIARTGASVYQARTLVGTGGVNITNGNEQGESVISLNLATVENVILNDDDTKFITPFVLARTNTKYSGTRWTVRASFAGEDAISLASDNNILVSLSRPAGGVEVEYSFDSITWTASPDIVPNRTLMWTDIAWGNGIFVGVAASGTGNRAMSSTNGVTWTSRTSAADNNWQSVTFGNGIFVAVANTGTGNRVMTSSDGINWTIRTGIPDNDWRSVTFGNGFFVAVASSGTGNRAMRSSDGITWTSGSGTPDNTWRSVTWGNNIYVAVSTDGTNRIMTSPDGLTWTGRSAPEVAQWRTITFGGNVFLAFKDQNTDLEDKAMVSLNGIDWFTRNLGTGQTARPKKWKKSIWTNKHGFIVVGGESADATPFSVMSSI